MTTSDKCANCGRPIVRDTTMAGYAWWHRFDRTPFCNAWRSNATARPVAR